MNKHTPCPPQEGNLRGPLLGGDFGVDKKVVGFCLLKPNLIKRHIDTQEKQGFRYLPV